jgi:UDP-N-acetylglucosamine:LPS N-acetylglucosamine transferase
MDILKKDLKNRLVNLDPQKNYQSKYKILVEEKLGSLPETSNHPLTILFSIGGAGAQIEIGARAIESLAPQIKEGRLKIIVSAGINERSAAFFEKIFINFGLQKSRNAEILFRKNIKNYFDRFNRALRQADILWTKPSELSFYAALGLPIIIAPPIGSQEDFNERWLVKSGFGIKQEDMCCVNQWLFDWLDQGYLAEAAMQGFVEGEKFGVYNIKKTVFL